MTMRAFCAIGGAMDDFIRHIEEFDDFGHATACEEIDGIPYMFNEFWTAKQRQSHSIHEISYRACFKAQLPEFFISRLTEEGDSVLDPFMGRGTTPVQSALMRRKAFGNDVNPLSAMLTEPRLRPICQKDVKEALEEDVNWDAGEVDDAPGMKCEDLLAFYHIETLRDLESLRFWLERRKDDPVANWIRMVAISRLTGHSNGFFSVRTMPPNQAVSADAQRRINKKSGAIPPKRDVAALIMKKSKSLVRDGMVPSGIEFGLWNGYAWRLPRLADGSIDLVVTSPPFLDVVQYADDNWLRCWFAGIHMGAVAIDMHRTEGAWSGMIEKTLKEMARVVRPGGHVAFEVGEVRNGKVLLERLVWLAAGNLPFERLGVMVNTQDFTKTANLWGVGNMSKGTNTNRIVILRRI